MDNATKLDRRTCPTCGATPNLEHASLCTNRILLIRPCCNTPVWRSWRSPHESWCQWADGTPGRAPIEFHQLDYPSDWPWRDLPVASVAR